MTGKPNCEAPEAATATAGNLIRSSSPDLLAFGFAEDRETECAYTEAGKRKADSPEAAKKAWHSCSEGNKEVPEIV